LGDFTNMVLSLNTTNKLFGMDISKNAVLGAKQKYPQIEFKQQTLPRIGYEKKFDGIISLDSLCYLNDNNRREAAKNIRMHLKPNGWFVFSSPADDGQRYFSSKQVFEMLEQGGFQIHKTFYNHARLYNWVEFPFLKIINLSKIIQEVDKDYNIHLTANKEKLRQLIKIPILGFLLKTSVKLSNFVSYRILKSIYLVNIFQWICRTFLKNRGISHIIVMSFRNE